MRHVVKACVAEHVRSMCLNHNIQRMIEEDRVNIWYAGKRCEALGSFWNWSIDW